MAFTKGTPKPPGSGRKKGTPNKNTVFGAEFVLHFLEEYRESGKMKKDWEALEPKDRISIAEKMMPYVMPKQAAVTASVMVGGDKSLEETLLDLAEEE